ncbi:hypothetical protein BD626DRAFT_502537 [Schizophyllum amplum]|uniref:AB hydrolase-1 domain-containing protein n=1 Tax=Schizophyllum amplum TaxID=97359 RepID=A0A550C8C1_9AGAR|nr:hypothetical protein BD626DRAFT_502537 [Auriculariopsis ampla]
MAIKEQTLVHLIYIHGFNGDETTFQSFPTDLQQHLNTVIPANATYRVQTSLYPTYKSVKPISTCTKNFLEWLNTQPPGYVILLAHSMGGLLAAEAVTHASNNPDKYPGARPSRIIGMISFDVPYLGMHPHVVITGLASLFAKDEGKETETSLNDQDPDVCFVDGRVTDDWESYKRNMPQRGSAASIQMPTSPASPNLLGPTRAEMSPFPPPRASSSSSSLYSSTSSPSSSFVERAGGFLASKADDPLVRWARKHRSDPVNAGKAWLIDHFQFGSCMFDPAGLTQRYRTLVAWNGQWVNYWTETVRKPPSYALSMSSSPSISTAGSPSPSMEDSTTAASLTTGDPPADSLGKREEVVDNDLALLDGRTAALSLDTLSKASPTDSSKPLDAPPSPTSSNDSPFVTPCGSPGASTVQITDAPAVKSPSPDAALVNGSADSAIASDTAASDTAAAPTDTNPPRRRPTRAKEEQEREKEVKRLRKEKEAEQKALQAEQKKREAEEKKREAEEKKQQTEREKALTKEQKALTKEQKPRHFVVLPTGLGQILGGGERWESVPIAGVEDEVAAHCGLFIRGQNMDYDGLVARVGRKVMDWCETARAI